jgi:hypothetical protein
VFRNLKSFLIARLIALPRIELSLRKSGYILECLAFHRGPVRH